MDGLKGGGGARPLPGVTAENYITPTAKFEEATGTAMDYAKAAGQCFMLYPQMQYEIAAWTKYYRIKGMKRQLKAMHTFLKGGIPTMHGINECRWAVPAQWPWQFDQSISEEQCS